MNRKHNNKPKPDRRLTFQSLSSFHLSVAYMTNKRKSMTRQTVQSDTKYNDQRLLRMSIRPNAFSFNFGSTRLVVEHANVLKCGPLQRPAFPRGIKSSCGRPGACRSKQYELKQNAEFGFDVNPQGSFQKCFKAALTSQGKSFRSAVHATTSRVLCKKESWQE